jgi:hypothetical protein
MALPDPDDAIQRGDDVSVGARRGHPQLDRQLARCAASDQLFQFYAQRANGRRKVNVEPFPSSECAARFSP